MLQIWRVNLNYPFTRCILRSSLLPISGKNGAIYVPSNDVQAFPVVCYLSQGSSCRGELSAGKGFFVSPCVAALRPPLPQLLPEAHHLRRRLVVRGQVVIGAAGLAQPGAVDVRHGVPGAVEPPNPHPHAHILHLEQLDETQWQCNHLLSARAHCIAWWWARPFSFLAFGKSFQGQAWLGSCLFCFQQEWHHPRERKLKQVVTECWSGTYSVCTCCTISSTVWCEMVMKWR